MSVPAPAQHALLPGRWMQGPPGAGIMAEAQVIALYLAELHGWTRFVTMQNRLNLLYREEEREMLPLCREESIGVIPWSPMARGRLTRDWNEDSERQRTDAFGKNLIYEGSRGGQSRDRSRRSDCERARCTTSTDGIGVGVAKTWTLHTDHRYFENGSPFRSDLGLFPCV